MMRLARDAGKIAAADIEKNDALDILASVRAAAGIREGESAVQAMKSWRARAEAAEAQLRAITTMEA